jgi:hypothetical protein
MSDWLFAFFVASSIRSLIDVVMPIIYHVVLQSASKIARFSENIFPRHSPDLARFFHPENLLCLLKFSLAHSGCRFDQ